MYASTKGEHLLSTSVQLFQIWESIVTILHCAGQFSCSYLTRYASELEEHAEAKISCEPGGKKFLTTKRWNTNLTSCICQVCT